MTSARRAPAFRSRTPSSTAPAYGSTTGGSSFTATATTHIAARDFAFDFHLFAHQLVLQGEQGFSRKGHRPHEASYYYSRPHLNVVGKLNGRDVEGGVARPRVVERLHGARSGRLGLVRDQSLRRRLAHGFRMRDGKAGVHFASPGSTFAP